MVKSKLLRALIARWGRLTRGMTLGVRVIARDAEGRVMLVRHGYAPGWHLPGGGVEVDETIFDSAIRELSEETGVEADGPPRLVGFYFNPKFGGRDHVALLVVESFRKGAEPPVGREIAERGWFALDALPEGTTPATRRRLDEAFSGLEPTPRW